MSDFNISSKNKSILVYIFKVLLFLFHHIKNNNLVICNDI